MANFENRLGRRKGKQGGDLFRLDTKNKTPEENIKEIIQGLYVRKPYQIESSPSSKNVGSELRPGMRPMSRSGSDSHRLSYLNALVMLLCKEDRNNLGFMSDELMTCIRVSLIDESMVIRAAALRVLRYLIKTESDVATFNVLKLPYLVIRSMDLMLRNEEERAQALRVVRRVIAVVGPGEQMHRRYRSAYIDKGLLRCLVAVACSGSEGDGSGDRLSRPAIATLAEICVLNPELFITCGGVAAVTRQLAVCPTPRMAEALCGVLLHTLNDPTSRVAARIDLTCLNSPYCDFHFRHAGTDSSRDEREMRFTCSRLALLCVLRSWPGLLHFCHPCSTGGLPALVRALSLPRLEVRKAILDLLYELVGLPQPEWTDEISVALDAVDPSDFQDSWRLNEGFVAAEGVAILPHLSATGPDIMEIHLALLLQCFLEAGLLDGLAEVIVTSDTFISVRATVLLGQLLHLIHLLLPPQICSITPALPSLISQASEGKPQALAAVAALRRLHSMMEARPASNSLFLDHIIQYCSGAFKIKLEDTSKSRKEKDNASMAKPKPSSDFMLYKDNSLEFLDESDTEVEPRQRHSVGSRADVPTRNVGALVKSKSVTSRTSAAVSRVFSLFERDSDSLIRSTLVMQNKDGNTWNWEIIRTILKETDGLLLLNLNDSGHKAWAGRIINYLKPSSNKYSHTDLSSTCHGHSATRAGCQLIRHLLRHNDADSQKLLEDLFTDVSQQIRAIETGRKAHECLFSPQHMCNTMCQMYFLFIGQLCHSHAGFRLFRQTKLYENLLELSTKTHHSCYVKLVISSLDYTMDSSPRDILAKTLTCGIQASRLYATQFLNVLLRASRKSRELVRKKTKLKKNIVQENWKYCNKDDSDTTGSVDMDTWILQMLVGQVKDESKVVAKCALSILEEAYSVPVFLEKMIGVRDALAQNCRLDRNADPSTFDFTVVGDRGYLLWLCLEVAAAGQTPDSKCIAFLKKHLEFWSKFYNYRYVRLVEAGVHEALTPSEGARRARANRRSARPPPHLHAALAALLPPHPAHPHPQHPHPQHPHPVRALLAAALPSYFKTLQRKKCATEQEIADLKASLWAIGNTAVTSQGLQLLMNLSNGFLEDSAPLHIVRLAKYSPVYSVRATAFYVLCLIGSTFDGANLLADLGWLCVRHTRHDQFPVIPDENYLQIFASDTSNFYVTSPDRRFNNTFDMDLSEHSDHTDQSTAESLHSETTKFNRTIGSVSEQADDVETKMSSISEGRRETDKRKSHTLPSQGCSSSLERSLTESRTVDILRDIPSYERPGSHRMHMENRLLLGRMNSLDHAHEGRVRNTSESSTSGVSSCDSFMGKYAIPDRVLTLSPIPSSSSLYGMKSNTSSQRPKFSESHRRTSTSSFTTTPDVASSPPTHMDMSGYATLKSLNRNRRPHLSEGAATSSSDMEDLSWLLTDSNRRTKPFSSLRDKAKSTRERLTKMSLLEYDWKPLAGGEGGEAGDGRGPRAPALGPPAAPAAAAPPGAAARAPVYMGICLPRDLMDLFPRDEIAVDGEETHPKAASSALGTHSFAMDSSIVTENKARITPDLHGVPGKWISTEPTYGTSSLATNVRRAIGVSSNVPTTAGITITTTAIISKPDVSESSALDKTPSNNTSTSLSVKSDVADQQKSATESNVKSADVGGKAYATVSETSAAATTLGASAAAGVSNVSNASNATNAGHAWRWQHSAADCLACVRTRPPSSHELREAFFAGMESEPGTVADSESIGATGTGEAAAEVLHHVLFMANPIHLKQSKSALLSLKQRHPDVFRSPCVYSDVCALLARDTYSMLPTRRFLQELFLDTSFDCFLAEPELVLARHAATPTAERH